MSKSNTKEMLHVAMQGWNNHGQITIY